MACTSTKQVHGSLQPQEAFSPVIDPRTAPPSSAPHDPAHAIVLDTLSKRYGSFAALDGLSLDVPHGIIQGFLGPNGAG